MRKLLAIELLITGLLLTVILGAADGEFTKHPAETRDLSFDFTRAAPNGITLISVKSINSRTLRDDSASIISQSSPSPAVPVGTNKVVFRVQNGIVGDKETILVNVLNSVSGEQLQGVITLTIAPAQ